MVKPFILPETLTFKAEEFRRLVSGPTFELFQALLQSSVKHLEKKVQVTGHHDVGEHVPGSPVTEPDGFDDHLRHVGSLEMRDVLGTVKPVLHLSVDATLKVKRPARAMFTKSSELLVA